MWEKCFCSQNDLKYPKINKKGNLKQSQKPTTPGIPRQSPIQVLTGLSGCLTSVIGRELVYSTRYGLGTWVCFWLYKCLLHQK